MFHVPGKDKKYDACLTTTIYGETYLDPEKCKARGFDPKKEIEEKKRTNLSLEWIERTTKEKGFSAQFKEFIDKVPQEYVNKDPKSLKCLDYSPIKKNKSDKKLSKKKIRSLMVKASHLVDHKIKLEDGLYVKVVAVKMNNDNIFLEVEEKVEDKFEYYEITYQQDMVGL
ncbi:hypothetical protein Glove_103g242 [Diversispora epigaea]|uniref:Uncharacterized protein n=1 Tax=Diversispora epigaea TaxID=1348612 RepID=A0A397J426_9GLOM|nr:hypothetical protein Glove_103g242 [Diversispora epigaea]